MVKKAKTKKSAKKSPKLQQTVKLSNKTQKSYTAFNLLNKTLTSYVTPFLSQQKQPVQNRVVQDKQDKINNFQKQNNVLHNNFVHKIQRGHMKLITLLIIGLFISGLLIIGTVGYLGYKNFNNIKYHINRMSSAMLMNNLIKIEQKRMGINRAQLQPYYNNNRNSNNTSQTLSYKSNEFSNKRLAKTYSSLNIAKKPTKIIKASKNKKTSIHNKFNKNGYKTSKYTTKKFSYNQKLKKNQKYSSKLSIKKPSYVKKANLKPKTKTSKIHKIKPINHLR